MKKGKVEIHRVKQWANKARTIGIYINNEKVGTIRNGETKTFELDCKENEIYAKIDWCKTIPLKVKAIEDKTIKFELGSNVTGWKMFIALLYITTKASEYLYLRKIHAE